MSTIGLAVMTVIAAAAFGLSFAGYGLAVVRHGSMLWVWRQG